MSLEPYSAIMMASYGGPDKPDDVLPFMRNATAGKNIPDERLLEVSEHYMMFGGKSPINELNADLMALLDAELKSRGVDVPIVIGNRNWHPFFADTSDQLVEQGHHRVLGVATSAYRCYSSCRQYCEDLVLAQEGRELSIDKLDPFYMDPAFAEINARALVASVRAAREENPDGTLRVLFVTHSIPITMNELSADGNPEDRYDQQHLAVARHVVELAEAELGFPLEWELTYCSRSGPPHIPWLEPDVNDRMEELKDDVDVVVAAPIGFISDHMEVLYDLDTEAKETAEECGFTFQRAATAGTDPQFAKMLADRMLDHAEKARQGVDPAPVCQFATGRCCQPPPRRQPAAS